MNKDERRLLARHSIRLSGYDYALPGAYFVTICTYQRACLLGEVVEGEVQLSAVGGMVRRVWLEIPASYPGVELDEFVVMPNHLHGIVVLVGAGPRARPEALPKDTMPGHTEPVLAANARPLALPDVVQRFKSLTTARLRHLEPARSSAHLWQRGYYEHVVRADESLASLRRYIVENPLRWDVDRENPRNALVARR